MEGGSGFPWASLIEGGGMTAVVGVLLFLLVDAYKQLAKQRDVIATLSETMAVKFEGLGAALTNACTVLGGAVDKVGEALHTHDDKMSEFGRVVQANRDRIDANAQKLEKLLDKLSDGGR